MLAKIAEMQDRIAPWPSGSAHRQRANPLAEDLVRDARVCQGRQGRRYFQDAQKFKSKYATFGFSDEASLDEGAMWPVAFALTELTAAVEARIGALVKKAVS